ncbi:MAG TPA: recombinase family protein [Bryobacteraceae bacterium]|nr:recombinase family protein [Bryobacteraceae bacterium]
MTKAFGYIRVSGRGQLDGDGFPRQRKAIFDHAAGHGLRIVRVFREAGVSGAIESMNRPAWRELMAALLANGVRTIVIERLDRLARDLMVQETVIADLHKRGFTLLSAAEPDLMAKDPTRILMRQLMGAVAQYDKSQTVLKLRVARDRIREKQGTCEGRKPFGYRDGEGDTLARMEHLRQEGLAYDKIASQLNAEGLAPRSSGQWYPGVVRRILLAQV